MSRTIARILTRVNLMKTPKNTLALLFLAAAVTLGQAAASGKRGLDRNELTSYTGVLKSFSRDKTHATLTIRTDEATTEKVKVPLAKLGKEKPQTGERLTAWVCTSGAVTIVWASPSPQR